jgi:hypothetical protein
MQTFLTETLRRVPAGIAIRARFDSGFYGGPLFAQMEAANVTYLCGTPMIPPILAACAGIDDEYWAPCLDGHDGEVAEFGYRLHHSRQFRRYIVKRIAIDIGEQTTLDTGAYRYWVLVTNDHDQPAAELESEHRHKAVVEQGMRELKSNFGLHAMRKHGFMANWVWLLLVCLGHNLCCWAQHLGHLGAGRNHHTLRAKRLRYRYLVVPAMLVRSGRQLTLQLTAGYPFRAQFLAALERLRQHQPPPT